MTRVVLLIFKYRERRQQTKATGHLPRTSTYTPFVPLHLRVFVPSSGDIKADHHQALFGLRKAPAGPNDFHYQIGEWGVEGQG